MIPTHTLYSRHIKIFLFFISFNDFEIVKYKSNLVDETISLNTINIPKTLSYCTTFITECI